MTIEKGHTTSHWETDAFGERRRFRHHILLPGRYFRVEWYHYFAKNSDYSPAFDTSITYDIVFEINDFDKSSGGYNGKILNLFVQEGAADIPQGRGGTVRILLNV